MIVSIRPLRKFLVLALALLVMGGCGGDDEPTPPATQEGTASEETTATSEPETTAVDPETETLPNDGDGTGTGESGQGGAGDEQAAETLALFTGKNGDITPRTVRVPAFISIRVELRSADGADYALRFDGRIMKVGETLNSLGVRFDGLRPGAKLVGRASTGGEVTVAATAEPGP
jgi:ABC-type transport system substrate-binding protein